MSKTQSTAGVRIIHVDSIIPSIEERLISIENKLFLVLAASKAIQNQENIGIDDSELAEASCEAMLQAIEDVHWLRILPASVLKRYAPTTDQQEAADRIGGAK